MEKMKGRDLKSFTRGGLLRNPPLVKDFTIPSFFPYGIAIFLYRTCLLCEFFFPPGMKSVHQILLIFGIIFGIIGSFYLFYRGITFLHG